ncbi:(d)CMP kinase [Blattabacterium punctulatus]|uniref:Cytidylate kinase n=1 Tax=Blattabacterium punctulatus TaxID=164514 RepID=A0ABM6WM61_9FLAO|nr:(d)CMP kinase [Blattabacterium punctulatus]AWU39647.1 (d)CMP kinase [Blattabacterium punctulatus]AWU40192.1 (d)CMP kinase [Blattabacterium punctulatus]AWU42446.1 (d)CMP kinase [Blattabacterium punctulatus]
MNQKMIIAIDGYSASGKSTLAQNLSKKLKYTYIDTGAMYRSITLLAIRKKMFHSDLWNITNFIPFLININFQFKWNNKLNRTDIFINKENVQSEIRSIEVSNKVSLIARIPEIRKKLTIIQKNFGNKKGIVMDGRDIGSNIFPQSELKIFMKGSIEVRSYRRFEYFKKKGKKISYEEVKKNLFYRDMMDLYRRISPLKKPKDSIEIDSTLISTEKQLNMVVQLIENIRLSNKKNKNYI